MKVIGLTAGIASGKSTILKIFESLDAQTIIADKIVRKLYKKKFMKRKLRKAFGSVFTKYGSLDRKDLAKIVFSDKKKLKKLERIVHPFVFREIKKQLLKIKKHKKPKLVIIEIPLLFEASKKFLSLVDFVVVVKAKKSQQLKRLLERGYSKKHSLQRMASQLPLIEKTRRADFVIDNSKSLSYTKKQVRQLFKVFV